MIARGYEDGAGVCRRLVVMEGGDVVVTVGKAVCCSGEGLVYGCVDNQCGVLCRIRIAGHDCVRCCLREILRSR